MNRKSIVLFVMTVLSCGVFAQEAATEEEKGSFETPSFISGEFGLSLESKYLRYGLPLNNEPMYMPTAEVTFFDFLFIGVEAIGDVTKYGKKVQKLYHEDDEYSPYRNRRGVITELDPYFGFTHSFSPDEFEWLPTTVEVSIDWCYERSFVAEKAYVQEETGHNHEDSQFIDLEIALPDLWLEPKFWMEKDIYRDNGTYLNFELGHTFAIIDSESEDEDAEPTVGLRLSAAQSWGDKKRVAYYTESSHAGLMDTVLKAELTWNICDNFAVSCYALYSDFIFDRKMRHLAREYEETGKWDESYNFLGGVAAKFSF